MMKRALVISGGGSKGAFAGGLANKLYKIGIRWDNFYGTSTGALLNTMISLDKWGELYDAYTSGDSETVFNKQPFTKKGRIKFFRVFWRVITGKTSIGEAKNLLLHIKKTFTFGEYLETVKRGKTICACVTNFSKGIVEFGYNTAETYDNFVKYVFASASVPLAMDVVRIKGDYYLDGGVMEHIPLQKAIDDGMDEIDVIVLRPDYSEINDDKWVPTNIFSIISRSVQLMMKEISEADIIISKLKANAKKPVKINIYFAPKSVKGNSLIFDEKIMKEWWEIGYNQVLNVELKPMLKTSNIDKDTDNGIEIMSNVLTKTYIL